MTSNYGDYMVSNIFSALRIALYFFFSTRWNLFSVIVLCNYVKFNKINKILSEGIYFVGSIII